MVSLKISLRPQEKLKDVNTRPLALRWMVKMWEKSPLGVRMGSNFTRRNHNLLARKKKHCSVRVAEKNRTNKYVAGSPFSECIRQSEQRLTIEPVCCWFFGLNILGSHANHYNTPESDLQILIGEFFRFTMRLWSNILPKKIMKNL